MPPLTPSQPLAAWLASPRRQFRWAGLPLHCQVHFRTRCPVADTACIHQTCGLCRKMQPSSMCATCCSLPCLMPPPPPAIPTCACPAPKPPKQAGHLAANLAGTASLAAVATGVRVWAGVIQAREQQDGLSGPCTVAAANRDIKQALPGYGAAENARVGHAFAAPCCGFCPRIRCSLYSTLYQRGRPAPPPQPR